MVLTAKFVTEEEATKYEEIVFRRDIETVVLTNSPYRFRPDYTGFPENPELKTLIWTSSDESIAAVADENGRVKVRITSYDKPNNIVFEKICIVNVKKEEEHQEIPSENEAPEIDPVYSYSAYTSKGVPTGGHMFVKRWITASALSLLGIGYLLKKKE